VVTHDDIAAYFERWPRHRLAALGHAENAAGLDLAPMGVPVHFLDAARHPGLVRAYAEANARAFPGVLALPGWVLADLYLLPGAITLLLDEADGIVAAWCGVPTVVPGEVMGVSLLAEPPGRGAAHVVKRLGVAMMRAHAQRGMTQWTSRSLRAHTRLGPLEVLGPAPAVHGVAERSFVYRCRVTAADPVATERVDPSLGPAHAAEAAAGARLWLLAPGVDDSGRLVVARGPG
jgi:hypothetical protein